MGDIFPVDGQPAFRTTVRHLSDQAVAALDATQRLGRELCDLRVPQVLEPRAVGFDHVDAEVVHVDFDAALRAVVVPVPVDDVIAF